MRVVAARARDRWSVLVVVRHAVRRQVKLVAERRRMESMMDSQRS
jgi:hypothetical protein